MRKAALAATAAIVATVTLALAPVAGAQPAAPPPVQGCNVVFVSNGTATVSLLGTLQVNTPGTSVSVDLGGLAGTIVCPILGGTVPGA